MTLKPEPATPDVVLAFIDALTRFTNSWRYYLFADSQRMADARIEAFGERCAFFMECRTQYEQHSFEDHELPASQDRSVFYYDTPEPNRPAHGRFETKKEAFPLRNSRKFGACPKCSAEGKFLCKTCRGHGRHRNRFCSNCAATGFVRCKRCNGEGSLITYKVHEFIFFHQLDSETLIPQEINDFGGRYTVRNHAEKAFRCDNAHFVLDSFTPGEVGSRLRIQNEEIIEAAKRASVTFNQLTDTASKRPGKVLFQICLRKVVPISYLNVRTGGRFGQFWAVGVRGQHTISLPPLPWDCVKPLAWLAAMLTILCGVAAVSAPHLPWPTPALVASVSLTGSLAWIAVRRHRVARPDRLIAVVGRESEDKTRLFALVGSLLCYQERAGFGDACYQQLFDLLRMNIVRTDLSASYRLTLRPSEKEADPVRLFMVSEGSLTSASPEAKRTLAAADILLLIASGDSAEDDALFARVLAALERNAIRPEVRLILTPVSASEQSLPQTGARLGHFRHRYLPVDIALLRKRFLDHQIQEPDVATMFQILSGQESLQEGTPQ